MSSTESKVSDFEMITAFRFNGEVYTSPEALDEARKQYYKSGAEAELKSFISQLNNQFEIGGGLPAQFEYLLKVLPDLMQLREIYHNPLPEPVTALLEGTKKPNEEPVFEDPRGGKSWFRRSDEG